MRIAHALIVALMLTLVGTASGAPVQNATITMRDFGFSPGKLTLVSDVPVALTVVNTGKVTHEFMVCNTP